MQTIILKLSGMLTHMCVHVDPFNFSSSTRVLLRQNITNINITLLSINIRHKIPQQEKKKSPYMINGCHVYVILKLNPVLWTQVNSSLRGWWSPLIVEPALRLLYISRESVASRRSDCGGGQSEASVVSMTLLIGCRHNRCVCQRSTNV